MKRMRFLFAALMFAACMATIRVAADETPASAPAVSTATESAAPANAAQATNATQTTNATQATNDIVAALNAAIEAANAAAEAANASAEAADAAAKALAPPEETHELPNDIHWFRNSAEARAAYIQTYQTAARVLESAVQDKPEGTWAVALDADETVLDNSLYQKERAEQGLGFTYDSWLDWCRREEATPLPGSVAFLERVHELGGKIAIVTNRDSSVQAETEAVFNAHGIPFDVMLTRQGRNDGEKERRWNALQDGTAAPGMESLEIVMWVGDNIKDFPDVSQDIYGQGEDAYEDFGTRYFVLPNPMYGSWWRNPKN